MIKQIPIQLQKKDFRFIKISHPADIGLHPGKQAIEKKWQTESNYVWDDPKLKNHKGNIGIVGGFGNLVIVDCDKKRMEEFARGLPETFEVRTSKTKNGGPKDPADPNWRGIHFYYIVDDLPEEFSQAKIKEDGIIPLGEVQGHAHYVVAPPSKHPDGLDYQSNEKEIASISFSQLVGVWPGGWWKLSNDLIGEKKNNINTSEKIKDGERYYSLVSVAGMLRRLGGSEADIVDSLQKFAKNNFEHLDGKEGPLIEKLAHDAMKWEPTAPEIKESRVLETFLTISEEQTKNKTERKSKFALYETYGEPEPPSWIIKDFIPSRGVVIIAGQPKCGKSMMIEYMLCDMLNKRPVYGNANWVASDLPFCVLIDKENSHGVFHERVKRMGGIPKNSLFAVTFQEPFDIENESDVEELHTLVKKIRPAVVVIDTLRRVFWGDENDSSVINELYHNALKPIEDMTTIILIAHKRKEQQGKNGGNEGMSGVRGSGDITGIASAIFEVSKKDDIITVVNTGMRQSQEIPAFSLKVEGDEGEPIKITYEGEVDFEEKKSNRAKYARDAIINYVELGKEGGAKPGDIYTRSGLIAICDTWGIGETNARKGIELLIQEGIFKEEGRIRLKYFGKKGLS